MTKSGVSVDKPKSWEDLLLLASVERFGKLHPEFGAIGLGRIGVRGVTNCNIDAKSISMNTRGQNPLLEQSM